MTSKPKRSASHVATLEKFPDFPPRDDMQNSLHLDEDAHQAMLRQHLGNQDTTIVLGEVPVRWTPSQRQGHRIPDLLVAFNVDRGQAIWQNGYSIQDLGKPPDLVLEVASVRTAENDVGPKRRDYETFGIPEYWRYDPTGGERYDAPLAGDRLVDGVYQPVEILELEPGHLHGYSEVLGLEACWDHGQLRWYNPTAGQHLLNFQEEIDARNEAERQANAERDARNEAERQANAERDARIAAERQASAERDARIVAEARLKQLEEELGAGDESQ